MAEHSPQITYDLESDALEVNTSLDEDIRVRARQQVIAEQLADLGGVEVELQGGTVDVRVEVLQVLADAFKHNNDHEVASLIKRIQSLMFADSLSTDRVVSVNDWYERAASGYVFPSFQRYINAGISETAAKETLVSMARPFGSKFERKAAKDFNGFYGRYSSWSFDLRFAPTDFRVSRVEEDPGGGYRTESVGEVSWNNLTLNTLGECACWGVTGEDRSNIQIGRNNRYLYYLDPHNWDFARQSLSMILGIGVLARHAAQYEGQEDILANVEWE